MNLAIICRKKAVAMFCRPAEWRKNKTIWLAWPCDQELWQQNLPHAQDEFASLVYALKKEQLMIIAPTSAHLDVAAARTMNHHNISYQVVPYGDIWLRDTFPIFVKDHEETVGILTNFNGWGKKYSFPHDLDLSMRITKILGLRSVTSTIVFEGGAVESDGAGTMLTTEQCLLNHNRNPHVDKLSVEKEFARCFGAKKIIWLKEGLKNDHTDGHIDTIARFIAPRTIAIMMPTLKDDPNYHVFHEIKNQLLVEKDVHNHSFELLEVPSPGAILDDDGAIMPASYLNFIMGDETLVVPTYGSQFDNQALNIFRQQVNLEVIGVSAKHILSGGGAFHCISQEFYR